MSNKLSIKKGDTVVVIAGEESSKTGKVIEVIPDEQRVVVEGVNLVQKHKKARSVKQQSGIFSQEAPIHASNVMVYCNSCKTGTRTKIKVSEKGKVRICNKCGAEIDK